MGTKQILTCLLLLAAAVASWFVLRRSERNGLATGSRGVPADHAGGAPQDSRSGSSTTPIETPVPDGVPRPEDGRGTPAALTSVLAEVGATFLGDAPRVADFLHLVEDMAAQAAVDPGSVEVQRDADGTIVLARGRLKAGGLPGTFQIEEGTFRIHFTSAVEQAPWSQRDLQLSFEQASGRASGCRAVVQYQPRPGESASAHLGPDQELLVGWTITVSTETGAEIRPMTLGAQGDEWRIGTSRSSEARQLPAASHTGGFDAWLRVLERHLRN